jgi:catechol 2,3-dioxygenase-like lactoylglutathione lyase family enzyme
MPHPIDLDHVAIALRDVGATLAALVGDLGARVLHGGHNVGFRVVQVRLGGPGPEGMTIELIEPWDSERFDFLARFLDRHGDGPHHLTFKVLALRDELAALEADGIAPVSTQLVNPWWREAFLHPKTTFGTVVQLAEAHFDAALFEEYRSRHPARAEGLAEGEEHEGDWAERSWWPTPPTRSGQRAVLQRVVLGVPDPEAAVDFFGERLRGSARVGDAGIDLRWPGGGTVRVEARDGDPGIDRLECEWDGPDEDRVIGGTRFRLLRR